jgi:hypothetical protein
MAWPLLTTDGCMAWRTRSSNSRHEDPRLILQDQDESGIFSRYLFLSMLLGYLLPMINFATQPLAVVMSLSESVSSPPSDARSSQDTNTVVVELAQTR